MILFLILILLLPIKQHPWFIFRLGPATSPQWLGVICLLYALAYMLFRKRLPRFVATWQARWYLLLTALMLVSYFRLGADFSVEANPAISTVSMFMLGFTILAVVDTLPRLRWVLLTTVASVGWASTYVIRATIKTRSLPSSMRIVAWAVGDANLFGVCIALVLPLAWYMSQEKRPKWERALCFGSAGLMLLAATLSGSRGGLLGLVAGMAVVIWRSRRRVRNFAIATLLLVVFNLTYPASPLQRLIHPTERDRQNAAVRLVQWNVALQMISEHPIGGIGMGQFKREMLKYVPSNYDDNAYLAHNAFLGIAAEMGIPAALAFAAMLLSSLTSLGRIRRMRSVPALVRQAATGLQAGVIGGMVAVFFVSPFEHRMLWFILFLSMVLAVLAKPAARSKMTAAVAAPDQIAAADKLLPQLNFDNTQVNAEHRGVNLGHPSTSQ
jgi:O-antigen ligase